MFKFMYEPNFKLSYECHKKFKIDFTAKFEQNLE